MAADKNRRKRIPALEWFSALLGLVIVAAMVGFLTFEAFRTDAWKPPLMQIEPVGMTNGGGGYVVEVKVVNDTRQTGASVGIEGTLKQGGSTIETSNATISYVPGKSHRRAGLVFTRDPRRYQLELRVTGYEQP